MAERVSSGPLLGALPFDEISRGEKHLWGTTRSQLHLPSKCAVLYR